MSEDGRWAWRAGPRPYTVGAEEELMLLDAQSLGLAGRAEEVIAALPSGLGDRVAPETHAGALEIATGVHATAGAAATELRALRAELTGRLAMHGLRAASAGIHPLALGLTTELSHDPRHRHLHDKMGALTRREPTFGLHVHVGLPDAETALRAFDRMRDRIPLLIGLAANSPFWRAKDSGLAGARTFVFDAFPRTGMPRAFGSYPAYTGAIDALIDAGAIPDATHVWWDLRLKPEFGTLEIRAMDAQRRVADTAPLIALVQCLVRASVEEPDDAAGEPPEVLVENRFLAMRDGPAARLIRGRAREELKELLDRAIAECRPHARALGCEEELEAAGALARGGGAAFQREAARMMGIPGVPTALAACYAPDEEDARTGSPPPQSDAAAHDPTTTAAEPTAS
ncbi:MAG: glutamate---cysteine ligase / carboxylate-amine ligase [Miltoncostaeaceae bacterium]|jgi:carboxylate-amine ligase|nr:glutamate---cysteine ligase / carboxylate-amine ligase [Miltoncostaeaceae bacterium]